ncbi:MAG: type II toxin-antitoxin system VapC family toxin [Sphingobium sp.]|nr:type II toxin-antitoxin system VapC family toxin [Sphingobium sp.]
MKLLLDTHILLWWLDDDPKLKPRLRRMLADQRYEIIVSIASLWEVAIKHQVGKLAASAPLIAANLAEQGLSTLSVSVDHLAAIERMPRHHGDPFDHLLLAQAQVEGAALMTLDAQLGSYGVPCIGIS